MKKDNDILMIMPTAFRFGWMGATRRIFQIANTFKESSYNVALLAGAFSNPEIQKEIDDAFPGPVFRTTRSGPYPGLFNRSESTRRLLRLMWRIGGLDLYWRKLSFGWAIGQDLDEIKRALSLRSFSPRLIWGITTGYLDGPLLAHLLSNRYDVPCALEIHDPPEGAGIGVDINAITMQYRMLTEGADKIFVTTNSYGNSLRKQFGVPARKIGVLHLSFDGEISNNFKSIHGRKIKFIYAGDLGAGRSLAGFIRALASSVQHHPKILVNIQVDLIGSGAGFDEAVSLAESLGVISVFKVHGKKDSGYCDKLLKKSSVIIVTQTAETSKMQIPGKIFTSLKYLKPILGLMPSCEASDVLLKSGLGIIHEEHDIVSISQAIIDICLNEDFFNRSIQPDRLYIESFSSKKLGVKMKKELEGII